MTPNEAKNLCGRHARIAYWDSIDTRTYRRVKVIAWTDVPTALVEMEDGTRHLARPDEMLPDEPAPPLTEEEVTALRSLLRGESRG